MKKKLLTIFLSLGLAFGVYGGQIYNPLLSSGFDTIQTVEEEDGSPSVPTATTLKVTNGTLTDNGDGTASINVGGTDDQTASEVSTNTASFDNNLSVADDTVQKALDTLDDMSAGSFTDFDTDYGEETVTSAWTLNNILTLQTDKYYIGTAYTDTGLNAGIDALGAEGGELKALEGSYTVDDTVTIDQNNTTITGSGAGTIFDASGWTQDDEVIDLNGKDNLLLRDFSLVGNAGGGAAFDLIMGDGVTRSLFQNLQLDDADDMALSLEGASTYNIVTNLNIDNSDGRSISNGTGGDFNILSGNIITNAGTDGIFQYGNYGSISLNLIDSPSQYGVYGYYCYNSAFGNVVKSSGYGGIWWRGMRGPIIGNFVQTAGRDGIYVSHSTGLSSISLNTIVNSGNGYSDISLVSGTNTVIGNAIDSHTAYSEQGIYAETGAVQNVIGLNFSSDHDTAEIQIDSGATNNLIIGNFIYDVTTASMINAGADNQILWNYFPTADILYTDTGTGTVFANWDEPNNGFWFYNEDGDAGRRLITLDRRTSTPADNDYYDLAFDHENDNDQQEDFANIRMTALDVSDGTEKGQLTFSVADGADGSMDTVLTLNITAPTWSVFPVTPSAAPDADYEVANKKYVDDNAGGVEVNNLETVCTDIADTEIFIGTGADTGNYAPISGDASLANTGAMTISKLTLADSGSDTGLYPLFATDLTGSQTIVTDASTTYNASTNAWSFAGNINLTNGTTAKIGSNEATIVIDLDDNNDSTEYFAVRAGDDSEALKVEEDGTVTFATLVTNLIDTTGAADIDYGSADVTDHSFTTDDCTFVIDGGITVSTGDNITLGLVQWNSGDLIDGEQIANDTIDDDSIDWGDVTAADITMTDAGAITSSGEIKSTSGNLQLDDGVIFIKEQADADADKAGYGQIWVNTATPNELWFTDDAGTDTQLGVGGGATTDGGAVTYVTSTTDDFAIGGTDSAAPFFFDEENETLVLNGQPSFSVKPTSTQSNFAVNSTVTIVFGTEIYDVGSDFASNTFTAPTTGKYLLNASLRVNSMDTASDYYQVTIVTSNRNYHWTLDPDVFDIDPAYYQVNVIAYADMDASDTAYITIYQGNGAQQTDIDSVSTFQGCLLH